MTVVTLASRPSFSLSLLMASTPSRQLSSGVSSLQQSTLTTWAVCTSVQLHYTRTWSPYHLYNCTVDPPDHLAALQRVVEGDDAALPHQLEAELEVGVVPRLRRLYSVCNLHFTVTSELSICCENFREVLLTTLTSFPPSHSHSSARSCNWKCHLRLCNIEILFWGQN